MPWLSADAFAVLHERAARAEARADGAEASAAIADARFDRLFAEYSLLRQKGADPTPPSSPQQAVVTLPEPVIAELQEFAGDPDLYDHLFRYAKTELARGTAADVVATAIRFGQQQPQTADHGEGAE